MGKGGGEEIEECYHGPTIRATAGGKAGQCTKPTNPTLENLTREFPPKVCPSSPFCSAEFTCMSFFGTNFASVVLSALDINM